MQDISKIYLCGLGAIGCSYASVLAKWKPDGCRIIADEARIKKYAQQGITVNSVPTPFSYLRPDDAAEPADLILIAVKRNQLEEGIKAIRNFVGGHTTILSLLNGIDSEEILGQEFGSEKILYSYVVATDATREGTSVRFSKLGTIVFGEAQNHTHSEKVLALKQLFDQAQIPYSIPEDMIRDLWWKFMMNVGINQTSAVMRAPYGTYQTTTEAREVMRAACMEVVRLAEKLNVNLTDKDVERYFPIIDSLMPEGRTSMLQDIEAGRKTEVEAFSGTVVELGRKHGIPTPINRMLYLMIRTIEQNFPIHVQ